MNKQADLDKLVIEIFRAFSNLELSLCMFLSKLLLVDQFRARVVWHSLPNFHARIRLISSLVDTYLEGTEQANLQKLLNKTQKVSRLRNRLAHQHYFLVEDGRRVEFIGDTMDAELGMKFVGTKTYDYSNLSNTLEEFKKLTAEFGSRGNFTTDYPVALKSKFHRHSEI
ncbi:MAG: hypothetical protein AAF340_12630 [Pseudomonadota bacterium]